MSQPSSPPRARACPVCRRPRSADHAPFCSQACRDRDLLQWLSDGYALPGPPADAEEADSAPHLLGENDAG